jgi:hypothetical protein
VPWLRLSRSINADDSQSIVTATPIELEEALGLFGAAATQLGEHELDAESGIPEEPVSLGSFTSTSAHVAGVVADRRFTTQWQPNV